MDYEKSGKSHCNFFGISASNSMHIVKFHCDIYVVKFKSTCINKKKIDYQKTESGMHVLIKPL